MILFHVEMFFLLFPHGAFDVDSPLDLKDVIHLTDISQGLLGSTNLLLQRPKV